MSTGNKSKPQVYSTKPYYLIGKWNDWNYKHVHSSNAGKWKVSAERTYEHIRYYTYNPFYHFG